MCNVQTNGRELGDVFCLCVFVGRAKKEQSLTQSEIYRASGDVLTKLKLTALRTRQTALVVQRNFNLHYPIVWCREVQRNSPGFISKGSSR